MVDIGSIRSKYGRKGSIEFEIRPDVRLKKKVSDLCAAEEVAKLLSSASALLPALLSKLGCVIIQMFDEKKKVRLG